MRRLTQLATLAAAALLVAALAAVIWLRPPSGQPAVAAPLSPIGLFQAIPVPPGPTGSGSGINVTGEGTVTVKPDIARVTLGVEVTNPSAAGAQQDAATRMDAVMGDLKNAGIEEKDIRTVRVDLSPDYDYSSRSPVLKGYRAANLVVVTVRDLSMVGALLDAVVASGATRLQGISFDVSDPSAAGAQGREQAMKNAKAKAEQLALLAGVTLGPPVSIDETVSAPPVPVDMVRQVAPAAAPAVDTPISPGTQEIRTMVRVTYSIQ